MDLKTIRAILHDLSYSRTGGSEEELRAAEYLRDRCEALGAQTRLESFEVPMGEVRSASLTADGRKIPCRGYRLAGSGTVEAPFLYLPNTDAASIAAAKGHVVLLDTGVSYFVYQDLLSAGALGYITYDGNVRTPDRDIDQKELRPYVSLGKKLPGVNINAKDAFELVRRNTRSVRIELEGEERPGHSQNVVAELPGEGDEWIVLTAHYDSTPLSRGAYDNLSGCIGLLEILEAMAKKGPARRGLRFVFCGSEERGLLGSKAYVRQHETELEKIALNVNLDMIGSVMGKFIACCSAETALVDYLRYMGAELSFGIAPRQGVYSSDSTPFADQGVPAVSFARIAPPSQATIHNRYDTAAVLSPERLRSDGQFLTEFTRRMAAAAVCPVKREIPEKVRTELDEYLSRRRKKNG